MALRLGHPRRLERFSTHESLSAGKEICVPPPPDFDWFDLIEYYAFRLTLSFLDTLYQVLKHKLKG